MTTSEAVEKVRIAMRDRVEMATRFELINAEHQQASSDLTEANHRVEEAIGKFRLAVVDEAIAGTL